LQSLIASLKAARIKPIADVVVDHRSGDATIFDYQRPPWTDPCDTIVLESNQCGSGTADSGYWWPASPGVNHASTRVQSDTQTT